MIPTTPRETKGRVSREEKKKRKDYYWEKSFFTIFPDTGPSRGLSSLCSLVPELEKLFVSASVSLRAGPGSVLKSRVPLKTRKDPELLCLGCVSLDWASSVRLGASFWAVGDAVLLCADSPAAL